MNEVWKSIDGFEGKYEVSNLGNVRSFARKNHQGKLLEPYSTKCGYLLVKLSNKGKMSKSISVHRLVALAFIDNPNNYPQVNHKDENKQNNRADNLEWCTAKYNLAYGTARDRATKSRSKPCVGIWPDGTQRTFSSIAEAERETGVYHGHISQVCNGIWKTAGKIKWSWLNE